MSATCKKETAADSPDEEAVEVEVGPFLGLPPVVLFAVELVALHGARGGCLGDCLEKDGAPGNVDVALLQIGGKLKLQDQALAEGRFAARWGVPYPCGVLVGL